MKITAVVETDLQNMLYQGQAKYVTFSELTTLTVETDDTISKWAAFNINKDHLKDIIKEWPNVRSTRGKLGVNSKTVCGYEFKIESITLKAVPDLNFKLIDYESIDITFFSNDALCIGDFVYGGDNEICRSFNNRKVTDRLIGISLNDVVDIDLTKQRLNYTRDEVQVDGKIKILTKGIASICLPYDSIPKGQNLYMSSKGTMTWRKEGPKFGKTLTKQDKDGRVQIKVKVR